MKVKAYINSLKIKVINITIDFVKCRPIGLKNLLVRFILRFNDDMLCEVIYKNLLKGIQPNLYIYSPIDGEFVYCDFAYVTLRLCNFNKGHRKQAVYCGMVVSYDKLELYLAYKAWKAIALNENLIMLHNKPLTKLGFTNVQAGYVIFLPVCKYWP